MAEGAHEITTGRPAGDTLLQLSELVNAHLGMAVPGWKVPAAYIGQQLEANPAETLLDAWVEERVTLWALEKGRLAAAAHILRYGDGEEVGADYRKAMDIGWLVSWPEAGAAAGAVLDAALALGRRWRPAATYAWDAGGWIPVVTGVAEAWPHIIQALQKAGFSDAQGRIERVYGGAIEPPGGVARPPVAGLAVKQQTDGRRTLYEAVLEGEIVGQCECAAELVAGHEMAALQGWGELWNMRVEEGWRGRGIGSWLLRHGLRWLHQSGCHRIALCVDSEDEARGAGRFYRRFGWEVMVTCRRGWQHNGDEQPGRFCSDALYPIS
jgi:GNAT superfamily N-acetyltransferase